MSTLGLQSRRMGSPARQENRSLDISPAWLGEAIPLMCHNALMKICP